MIPRPSRSVRMKSLISSAGSPKNFCRLLIFQHQQLPLDGADRGAGDVAVGLLDLGRVVRQEAEHGAQVLEVQQRQAPLVGDAEGDVEHAFLGLVEVEQPRQQQRPHFCDGGADRVTLLAEQIPEHDRKLVGLVGDAELLGAIDERLLGFAGRRDAGQVALDVGSEDRDAGARKTFRQHLQRHGLAGAGGAGDEPVPVGERERQHFGLAALADKDRGAVVDRCGRFRCWFCPGWFRSEFRSAFGRGFRHGGLLPPRGRSSRIFAAAKRRSIAR